jgi:PTH1 family peptidyl-tRNA hydrolase
VKPLTYMNRSGEAVRDVIEATGVTGEQLLVVHDDLDLPSDAVRVKVGGGHGGNNGLRSILSEAEAGEFVRVRLGIGREDRTRDAAAWVLEQFEETETKQLQQLVERGADAVSAVLAEGAGRAMTAFNRRRPVVAEQSDDVELTQRGVPAVPPVID